MRRMILSVALSMGMGMSAHAAQIYKWVDAQGVTHFDATPPAGQPINPVDIQKPPMTGSVTPPAPTPEADAQQRAIDDKVKKEVKANETRRSALCETMRTNLAQLRNNPRVREPVAGGGFKRLNEQERQVRIQEAEKTIAEYCL
ncbi:DUF4124 domain-containing protein [Pseudomonas syringae]|nr:DUF4124 domain-containing protein [Pseudomonas syringae]MBD8577853.1 DUF4124 domain-containing protein [Pseudomonas syringae]MBD8793367.1 DUF4124 domain-containing protein [Pseudomonas syringae]MBD8804045.1 DUF4124 domain-containing protein [Pseudomonas syringae]MBD8814901.1 DUF4124 domain-containing protein [Pseudomonas syringae]